jgi:YVTN family beta-propeller protein
VYCSHEKKDHYGFSYLFKYLRIFSITIIKSKYRFLLELSVGVTLIMSVVMVASKSVTAQSIETLKGPVAPDQLQANGDPRGISVNMVTNKIYILNSANGTVMVLDSKSGTVKNIPVGIGYGTSCPYCIGVDSRNSKIYVANTVSDTVSVIDGNSDTVKTTIPVGYHPQFILVTQGYQECCKVFVANTDSNTVSVIDDNSDTVKKTIHIGIGNQDHPRFILVNGWPQPWAYVASDYSVSVIDPTDTVNKTIPLPHTITKTYTPHPNGYVYARGYANRNTRSIC